MAFVKTVSVEDLSCPVCSEIFKAPVILSCSHSVCKECLQKFWETRNTQDCPICRRRSSKLGPPCNLVLKNLCESLTVESASRSEEVCSLHNEKLKLFCLDDEQPVCVVCRDSEKHASHRFRPINEVVPSYKLGHVLFFTRSNDIIIRGRKCKKLVSFFFQCSEYTERQIKEEFKKFRQFLQDEEEASITALRKEEEQKMDVIVLSRAQSSQQDPQILSGALVNVANYLINLTFRVWKKMQELVQNTPVTLDPNTAHPRLILSDLTSLRRSKTQQLVPDNPERFDKYSCALGSEGFNSGTHFWDVEVGDNSWWIIGVTTQSNKRKGADLFNTNVWCVWYKDDEYFSQSPEIPNNPLFKKVFPFFYSRDENFPLRILPAAKVVVGV
uniref:Zinc-binding protein A33-like n=1 Tax=Sinocyclocheilus anshuiensis TaxID=1608454 RepID=A0A671MWC2_9TELE